MKLSIFALALLGSIAFSQTPALAQTVDAAKPSSIVSALQAGGYKAVLGKDDSGDPQIKSAGAGASFTIYFYGCTANADCRSVQFYAAYTVKPKLNVAKMNEWNAKNRFSAAFLDKDGDPAIQYDVVTEGGMPTALFNQSVDRWTSAMGTFQTFIGW